jgi:hypothetical protein
MTNFDNLKATRNEKIDLIRMALSNYTSPYKVSGSDAVALNNLTEFISHNILFKKRQDYTENDLSNMMYKYAYRYFTQFVNPIATVDLIEMMILYNKYMVFNIGDNAIYNIFNISEKFTYTVTLIDTPNNINQDSSRTYSFSIPYVNNVYRENFVKSFRLKSNQFSVDGKILNLGLNGNTMVLNMDFELLIHDGSNPIEYNLINNGQVVAKIKLDLVETEDNKSREYIVEGYSANIISNFERDMYRFIDNMYISEETKTKLIDKGMITGNDQEEIDENTELVLSVKKSYLRNLLEEIKTNGILNGIILKNLTEYAQNNTVNYFNSVTNLNINVSKLARDAIKHVNDQIKFTGIETDELHIIFKNSVNSYVAGDFPDSYETTFEGFLNDMFR